MDTAGMAGGLMAANPYGAAIQAGAQVVGQAVGGPNLAKSGQVTQGGNISFGSSGPAWMMPAALLLAAFMVAMTLKRKG